MINPKITNNHLPLAAGKPNTLASKSMKSLPFENK